MMWGACRRASNGLYPWSDSSDMTLIHLFQLGIILCNHQTLYLILYLTATHLSVMMELKWPIWPSVLPPILHRWLWYINFDFNLVHTYIRYHIIYFIWLPHLYVVCRKQIGYKLSSALLLIQYIRVCYIYIDLESVYIHVRYKFW
jgi:hypothetical protein